MSFLRTPCYLPRSVSHVLVGRFTLCSPEVRAEKHYCWRQTRRERQTRRDRERVELCAAACFRQNEGNYGVSMYRTSEDRSHISDSIKLTQDRMVTIFCTFGSQFQHMPSYRVCFFYTHILY